MVLYTADMVDISHQLQKNPERFPPAVDAVSKLADNNTVVTVRYPTLGVSPRPPSNALAALFHRPWRPASETERQGEKQGHGLGGRLDPGHQRAAAVPALTFCRPWRCLMALPNGAA